MNVQRIKDFIKNEEIHLKKAYPDLRDKQKIILAIMVKIQEELGELANEVLAYNSFQRKDKLSSSDNQKISEEIADVIISTMMLAKSMDIDIEDAIEKKIEKIESRHKNL